MCNCTVSHRTGQYQTEREGNFIVIDDNQTVMIRMLLMFLLGVRKTTPIHNTEQFGRKKTIK